MVKHKITDWQFYWPHWYKLYPTYRRDYDNDHTPPVGYFVFTFGPLQVCGYYNG